MPGFSLLRDMVENGTSATIYIHNYVTGLLKKTCSDNQNKLKQYVIKQFY